MSIESRQLPEKNEYLLGFESTQQQRAQRESLLPLDPSRATQAYGVVLVDASADVSTSMAASPRLRLLPLAVRWPGRTLVEKGQRSRLRHLGREMLRGALIEAPAVDSLEYRLYPPLALNADWLIHVGTRRELVDTAIPLRQMLDAHAPDIVEMRRQRGLDDRLPLALVDSGSLLSGTALLARMVLRMLEAGIDPAESARRAQALAADLRLWLIPQHPSDTHECLQRLRQPALVAWEEACARPLRHLWRRHPLLQADAQGLSCHQHLKSWRAAAASCLEQVGQMLRDHPGPGAWLQLSFDGSLRELQTWPEFDALRRQAAQSHAHLHLTHMSAAGRIWASAGSMSVALYLPPTSM
jgi:hypothetical protein